MPLANEPSRLFAASTRQASGLAQDFDRSSVWKGASRSWVTGSTRTASATAMARVASAVDNGSRRLVSSRAMARADDGLDGRVPLLTSAHRHAVSRAVQRSVPSAVTAKSKDGFRQRLDRPGDVSLVDVEPRGVVS